MLALISRNPPKSLSISSPSIDMSHMSISQGCANLPLFNLSHPNSNSDHQENGAVPNTIGCPQQPKPYWTTMATSARMLDWGRRNQAVMGCMWYGKHPTIHLARLFCLRPGCADKLRRCISDECRTLCHGSIGGMHEGIKSYQWKWNLQETDVSSHN